MAAATCSALLSQPSATTAARAASALWAPVREARMAAAKSSALAAVRTKARHPSRAGNSVVTMGRPTARYSFSFTGLQALIQSLWFHGMISTSMAAMVRATSS